MTLAASDTGLGFETGRTLGFEVTRAPRTAGRSSRPEVTWRKVSLNYVPPRAVHTTRVRYTFVGRGKPLPIDNNGS